jgi:hypothetical protein
MQINQYANEVFIINDEDFYDVDFWTGSAFQSSKISGATLKSILGNMANTIYTGDGTLTGDRLVDLAGNVLTFESSGDAVLQVRSASSAVLNLVRGTGFKAWAILKDVDGSEDLRIDRHDGTGTFLDTPIKVRTSDGVIEFNGAYRFPTTDGSPDHVLATDGSGNLSWIGLADVNIYTSNGSLTGNRFLDLANFALYMSDLLGSTKFIGGNQIELLGNSNQPVEMRLDTGNGDDVKSIHYLTGGVSRWRIETDETEIGGDTGTNLYFKAYDDSGILIGVPLKMDRQSGQISINNQYSLPIVVGSPGYVLTTDGIGGTSWQPVGGSPSNSNVINGSTQWSKNLPATVPLGVGAIANGCTFFDNIVDKVSNGTTSYYEFDLYYGITITLSGTSGTANINVLGINYLATFNTSLFQTAVDWVNTNQVTLNALGVQCYALGSGTNGRIRFGKLDAATLNAITITTVTGNLSGTKANEFTGSATAAYDHIVVPYTGTPVDGQRLLHTIRANFNISLGSVQYAELGLYRWQNDTIIGSSQQIIRNPHTTGQQVVIETYTAGPSDPFVTGGFYVALRNTSNTNLDFTGNSGILIQTIFQKPTIF